MPLTLWSPCSPWWRELDLHGGLARDLRPGSSRRPRSVAATPAPAPRPVRVMCSSTTRCTPSTLPMTPNRTAPIVPFRDVDARGARRRAPPVAGRPARPVARRASTPRPAASCRTTPPHAMRQHARLPEHRLRRPLAGRSRRCRASRRVGSRSSSRRSRCTRTSSMRWLRLVSCSGSTSLAQPGSMPLTCRLAPSRRGRCRSIISARQDAVRGTAAAPGRTDTTLTPASHELAQVVDRLEHPVVGHGAVHDAVGSLATSASRSLAGDDAEVAAEPGQLAGVLAGLVRVGHPDADELQSRVASIPAIAWRPTVPVDQTTTRRGVSLMAQN